MEGKVVSVIKLHDDVSGVITDLAHDSAYAHALVQALRDAPDMTHQRQWIFNRADEIMRGFGYTEEAWAQQKT